MERPGIYFPGYAAFHPQIIRRDARRAPAPVGATGRKLPPFAARPRRGNRAGLRRSHRRPVGCPLGEARVVDLARRLGVTHVTVNRTLARLKKAGFVNTKPYRAIFLTKAGHTLAEECKRRHETVVAFLRSLGVPEKAAEMDAEGIEHHVSPETLAVFERLLKKS